MKSRSQPSFKIVRDQLADRRARGSRALDARRPPCLWSMLCLRAGKPIF